MTFSTSYAETEVKNVSGTTVTFHTMSQGDKTYNDITTTRIDFAEYQALEDYFDSHLEVNGFDIDDVDVLVPEELETAGFDGSDFLELCKEIEGNDDFTIETNGGKWRIISEEEIATIHRDEVTDDDYMLGCFNADFIARHTNLPQSAIVTLQQAEGFEGIGQIIKEVADLDEFADAYARADGYGHHFAHYDHNEYTFKFDGTEYHVFRTN